MPTVRSCEIVSRLEDDNGNTLLSLETVENVLKNKTPKPIKEYAYIIHDKDIYTSEDEASFPNHKSGSLKPPHIHLIIRFERNQPQKTEYIAKWFGIGENFISKIRGQWEDAVIYLIHKNAEDKYQYDNEEIISNFDTDTIINCYSSDDDYFDIILQRILNGEIREYNKTLEIDNMLLVNPKAARCIDLAFKTRAEYLQASQQERHTTVIYITGKSGAGKTTLAKKIATDKGLDYYISSGSRDIMDGYAQQPCLICDDIRPSCLGMSDLLKMLDPYTACSGSSRYKNKYLNCELLILTSVLPIDEFYHNVFENEKEPITQLKRRCKYYIYMDMTSIRVQEWDSLNMRYTKPIIYLNDMLFEFQKDAISDDKTPQEHIEELIPFLAGKKYHKYREKAIESSDMESIKSEQDTKYQDEISDDDFLRLLNDS